MNKSKYKYQFQPCTRSRGVSNDLAFQCQARSGRCVGTGLHQVIGHQHDKRETHLLHAARQYFNDILDTVTGLDREFQRLDNWFSCSKTQSLESPQIEKAAELSTEDTLNLKLAAKSLLELVACLKHELAINLHLGQHESCGPSGDPQDIVVHLEQKLCGLLRRIHYYKVYQERKCASNYRRTLPNLTKIVDDPTNHFCQSISDIDISDKKEPPNKLWTCRHKRFLHQNNNILNRETYKQNSDPQMHQARSLLHSFNHFNVNSFTELHGFTKKEHFKRLKSQRRKSFNGTKPFIHTSKGMQNAHLITPQQVPKNIKNAQAKTGRRDFFVERQNYFHRVPSLKGKVKICTSEAFMGSPKTKTRRKRAGKDGKFIGTCHNYTNKKILFCNSYENTQSFFHNMPLRSNHNNNIMNDQLVFYSKKSSQINNTNQENLENSSLSSISNQESSAERIVLENDLFEGDFERLEAEPNPKERIKFKKIILKPRRNVNGYSKHRPTEDHKPLKFSKASKHSRSDEKYNKSPFKITKSLYSSFRVDKSKAHKHHSSSKRGKRKYRRRTGNGKLRNIRSMFSINSSKSLQLYNRRRKRRIQSHPKFILNNPSKDSWRVRSSKSIKTPRRESYHMSKERGLSYKKIKGKHFPYYDGMLNDDYESFYENPPLHRYVKLCCKNRQMNCVPNCVRKISMRRSKVCPTEEAGQCGIAQCCDQKCAPGHRIHQQSYCYEPIPFSCRYPFAKAPSYEYILEKNFENGLNLFERIPSTSVFRKPKRVFKIIKSPTQNKVIRTKSVIVEKRKTHPKKNKFNVLKSKSISSTTSSSEEVEYLTDTYYPIEKPPEPKVKYILRYKRDKGSVSRKSSSIRRVTYESTDESTDSKVEFESFIAFRKSKRFSSRSSKTTNFEYDSSPPSNYSARYRKHKNRKYIRVGSEQYEGSMVRVIEYDSEDPLKTSIAKSEDPSPKEVHSRGTSTEVLSSEAKRTSTTELIKIVKAVGTITEKTSLRERGVDPMPLKKKTPPRVSEVKTKFTNTDQLKMRSTGTDAAPQRPKPTTVDTATEPQFYIIRKDKHTNTSQEKKASIKNTGTNPTPIPTTQKSTVATDPIYFLEQKSKFTNTVPIITKDAQTSPTKPAHISKATATSLLERKDKRTSYDKVKTSDKGVNPIPKEMISKALQFDTLEEKPTVKAAFTETEPQDYSVRSTQTSYAETKDIRPSMYDIETQTVMNSQTSSLKSSPLIETQTLEVRRRPQSKKKLPAFIKQQHESFSKELFVLDLDKSDSVIVEPSEIAMHLTITKSHEDLYKRCDNLWKLKRYTDYKTRRAVLCENITSGTIKINASDCTVATGNKGEKLTPITNTHLNVRGSKSFCTNNNQRTKITSQSPGRFRKTRLSTDCGMDFYKRLPFMQTHVSRKDMHYDSVEQEHDNVVTGEYQSGTTVTCYDWKGIAERMKVN